jgi:hypothetical protein
MPYKYDAAGALVTAEHNGKLMPVFINAKGDEAPFDADGTVATIARLNGEAQTHREGKEEAVKKLKDFDGIADPAAARKALEIVSNLDAKKLVDAGEIERVRNEIKVAYESQIDVEKQRNVSLEEELYAEKVGGAFSRSKFIAEKFAIPADFVQARFGANFGIEEGRIYAVDAAGNKLYSQTNPGVLADFDEALSLLVDAYPQKDAILKGTGAVGGGAREGLNGNGGSGNSKGKGNMGGTRDERATAIGAKFPELGKIEVDV